jgi:hypothetical protein
MKSGQRSGVAPEGGPVRPRAYASRLNPQLHMPLAFKPLDSSVIVSKRNKFSGVILLGA